MTKHQRFQLLMKDMAKKYGEPDAEDTALAKEFFDTGYRQALFEAEEWLRTNGMSLREALRFRDEMTSQPADDPSKS